ncbi:hypothetical protein GCM10009689_16970 [Brevibacterium antiquum]|uniref:hypothetical protein n=1 Tax=Brevibacterium antiquum TaxID=234835 RepID=UPI0018DEF730|nr:hypothetical protein [Brevibacterium antiquum]
MAEEIRVALRDWDWLTPWANGEIGASELAALGYSLRIDPLNTVVDLPHSDTYVGAEASLSKYVQAVANGNDAMVALPHLLMQGFRHRCIIVATDSNIESPSQLVGGKIGITGWPDSGNVWTRAALADAGLNITSARWCAGRLTADHPETDRLGEHGVPGRIEAITGKPMIDRLSDGELDAVLTPFMPPGFYTKSSRFRPLYRDVRVAEQKWAAARGFVPGHHILAFKKFVPAEAQLAVSRILNESKRQWTQKRHKYAETTAWTAVDFWDEAQTLPEGWDRPGLASQRNMLAEFVRESVIQGLLDAVVPIDTLFPLDIPNAA